MSTTTPNLNLIQPSKSEKGGWTTYTTNNQTIDAAYREYLDDKETAQENIAMIESHTAQSNHAIGSYFMLDNVLHKATSAIASGEMITSGENATPITLEQALSALNNSVSDLQNLLSAAWVDITPLSGINMSYGKVKRVGNVCFLVARFVAVGTYSGQKTVATVPVEYRPPSYTEILAPIGHTWANETSERYSLISSTGEVKIVGPGGQAAISMVYFV